MRNAKLSIVLAGMFALAGCGARSSDNFEFEAKHVKYDIDTRNGRCFAAVGTRQVGGTADGMSISYVPCDKDTLKMIDPNKIQAMRENGIEPKI